VVAEIARSIRKAAANYPLVQLVVYILLLWICGGVFLWLTEGQTNAEYDTMPKALWNISVCLFSGLDSGIPKTTLGRIGVTVVLILSLGLVAIFTGTIASFMVEQRIGSKMKMPGYQLKDHVLICNWNDKGIPIISELHAAIVKDKRPIVIISESTDAGDLPDDDDLVEFRDVYLVKGDPANEVILRRAHVQDAYSVIVLADPSEGQLADAKSILVTMAVKSVNRTAGSAKPHICVECIGPQNVRHLQRAGADEIISAADFAMMLMAQSALAHGLSTVYHDLLTVSGETNEIYIIPVPSEFMGKSFDELGIAMFKNRDPRNPAILAGVATRGGIVMNPPPGAIEPFQDGDRVVVIALEKPDRLV